MAETMRKLKSSRGETLVETLVSILVAALSVAVLVGGVTAAGRINLRSESSDTEFYALLTDAEAQTEPLEDSIRVTIRCGELQEVEIPARLYGGEGLLAYGRAAGEAAP